MPNSCDCWVVISNFTEKGITPRIYSEDIPIKETELKVLNTYYASILNYTTEDSIIGPLPVAYHPELFVLLYRFDIIDNNVNDKRVIAVKGKTLGLITIFYNTKYDEIFVNSRKEIFDLLISWIKKFDNISQIDDFHINKLSEQIKNIELLDSYSDQEMGTDEEYKLINRQLDFLAKFVRGEFNLQIISDSLTYLDTLK
ncbi:MAG: hypothetical protein EAX90_13440, partial [Candidatus Heimdallarchaeota archaeon]|nr:hypothetical protein [Candidatus Heimdallarchaeota archaeon]